MSYSRQTKLGRIEFNDEVVSTIAGGAAVECYGVIGMASKNVVRDGISELLKIENYSKGVVVTEENGMYNIDMFVVLAYSVKVSEVVVEIQKKVEYTLEKYLGIKINSVNVFVQEIRVNR
jgi:uncharacterized alkaline shock family protein YloU